MADWYFKRDGKVVDGPVTPQQIEDRVAAVERADRDAKWGCLVLAVLAVAGVAYAAYRLFI